MEFEATANLSRFCLGLTALSEIIDIDSVNTATSKLNKVLKSIATQANIDKNLVMHNARNSFGNIAGDKIPIHTLQKLYRHSSIITTANYQQSFTNKDTDDAIDKVVGF